MQKNTVSVVIPVYNGEDYIARCLKSIQGQTYENLQILVVDDGSGDGTGEIVRELASRDSRIQYLRKENGGVSKARNYGLEKVTGKYVCFADADDWVDARFVEDNVKIMEENAADLVVNDFYYDTESGSTLHGVLDLPAGAVPVEEIRKQTVISDELNSMGTFLYSAEKIRENGIRCPGDIRCGEDNIFNMHYADRTVSVQYTKKAYYHYEIHGGSGCRHLHPDQLRMYDEQLKIKRSYGEKWGGLTDGEIACLIRTLGSNLAAFALMAQSGMDAKTYAAWAEELYGTQSLGYILSHKRLLEYAGVPRTYRLLLKLLLAKNTRGSYLYTKAVNRVLHRR